MPRVSYPALRSFVATTADVSQSFEDAHGFIFAVAGAPVPPSAWLPEVFGGATPEFESQGQAQAVLEDLMALYNDAVAGGRRTSSQAPAFVEPTLSNMGVWTESLTEEMEEELAAIVVVLTFFESQQMAETFRVESGGGKSLGEIAETMRRTFGEAMVAYVDLGRAMYRARLQLARAPTADRAATGRNASCPRGSGKKYKRCCGTAPSP